MGIAAKKAKPLAVSAAAVVVVSCSFEIAATRPQLRASSARCISPAYHSRMIEREREYNGGFPAVKREVFL
jgi:hypothetical protein